MSKIPDYTHNVSLRMSQVMDEIGVNEMIVIKRRKLMLLRESLHTIRQQLMDEDMNTYFFGSQMEGTTTIGLDSDIDFLYASNRYKVIQDLSEWEQGKLNLLMIQDETVSPGYCFLQVLRDDAPLPTAHCTDKHSFRDIKGRILVLNTMFNDGGNSELERNGPAQSEKGRPGYHDADYVAAYTCQSCPVQVRKWLDQQREGFWPSNDMIKYCYDIGYFVVGVGNKGSENEKLEWRISTSQAERCFMFNLNITQIRCYVLMKMILKTFVTQHNPNSISSFMCKTVLFHCISNTRADEWKENTFLTCLTYCLSTLYNCVLKEYCPHFIITENNLMMRRFSQETKAFILKVLNDVIESNKRALFEIEIDSFGLLLQHSINGNITRNLPNVSTAYAGDLLRDVAIVLSGSFKLLLYEIMDLSSRNAVRRISSVLSKFINTQHTRLHRKSFTLIAKHLCHTVGTILASSNIDRRDNLSYMTLSFLSLGLTSDVACGKLKLASVFYCIGNTERTELILKCIEECYDLTVVEPICNCYFSEIVPTRERFDILCYESNQEHSLFNYLTASCVQFLRCEVNCCPFELRYEMFRSTQKDLSDRDAEEDWTDMALVDSLPFLYFLQYKIYSGQGRQEKKSKALLNLVRAIEYEANLGHRETALNLLGQCMEKENQIANAFKCYALSLEIRRRNNSANVLICILLNTMINHPEH